MPREALDNLRACHSAAQHLTVASRASQAGAALAPLAAKAAIALLQSVAPLSTGGAPLVPIDKALFLAGSACRSAGSAFAGAAFVLLNAFVDVTEAMEDGSAAALDLAELSPAGLPATFLLPPPSAAYVGAEEVEAVKEWVISAAMQAGGEQTLREHPCSNCGHDHFAGALTCSHCGASREPCAVTGWPVPPAERVEPRAAVPLVAARDDYNAWVAHFGTCPVTGEPRAVLS